MYGLRRLSRWLSDRSTWTPTAVTTSSPYIFNAASIARGSPTLLSLSRRFHEHPVQLFALRPVPLIEIPLHHPSPPRGALRPPRIENVPSPSSSDLARYTSDTTGSLRIASVMAFILSSPSDRPNSSFRLELMRYVAVAPRSAPTAPDPGVKRRGVGILRGGERGGRHDAPAHRRGVLRDDRDGGWIVSRLDKLGEGHVFGVGGSRDAPKATWRE